MQHGLERSARHFLLKDAAALVIGLAGVDHQRQAGLARGCDMRAEPAFLGVPGAVVVEIVEPGLAERDHLGMPGQRDQLRGRDAVLLIRIVRMGADRAEHVLEPLGDREQLGQPAYPGRDRHQAADAGSGGARDDAIQILSEIRKIQMAVRVDQHHAAVGSM